MNASSDPTSQAGQVCVARQPILDKSGRIFGYELLYRQNSSAATRAGANDDLATASVIDGMFAVGLDVLTGGKKAFINVSRRLLLDGIPAVLPRDKVVLELGADIEADSEILAACRQLRQDGYLLAVDDFVMTAWTAELVPLAHYLKIDFLRTQDSAARLPMLAPGEGPSLIAKKIETAEKFKEAVVGGYDLFQGFFLGKPVIKEARAVPAQHMASLRLMHALHDPDLSVHQLEELVKHDPALCFLILRTVNSAAYALRTTVQSIREALVLLGRDTVRRWASLWALAGLSQGAHGELLAMATIRARCCELLGASTGDDEAAAEGFLVGMCSVMDAILQQPMPALVASLPLPDGVRDALLGQENATRRLLDCTVAYEQGSWERCFELSQHAGVNAAVLPAAYAEALRWSNDLRQTGGATLRAS
jgi:EAL and modified HD-GYP domain-containing signal transduction protein